MPNYQEMMNTSMGAMGSGGRGQSSVASSFTNFTSVNVMLKGFMELQKEQLKVEKAKAEAKGIYYTGGYSQKYAVASLVFMISRSQAA